MTAAAAPCRTIATTGTSRRRADLGDAAEEQPVLGHREIDARRGQHALAEEAERRDGDADARSRSRRFRRARAASRRSPASSMPASPAGRAHGRRRRRRRCRAGSRRPRRTAGRARGRAADRASRRRRSSRSASRHKRTSPASSPRRSRRSVDGDCEALAGGCGCEPGDQQADEHQRGDRQDLQHHQPALDVASRAHAEAIDQRSAARATATATALSGNAELDEIAEIAREGDRDRGHSARLDDQQQRPAVEEGRHRARRRRADRHIGRRPPAAARPARHRRTRRRARPAPPSSQTPTISRGVPTCRATSAGLTKMPEPMIPPMTSMVASNRPSRRARPWASTWRRALKQRRSDHVPHRIKPGRLADEEARAGERALGEDHPAFGAVRQARSAPSVAEEHHVMLAGDACRREARQSRSRPARGVEARVRSRPQFAVELGPATPRRRVAEQQRCARRRVGLEAVMHFDNLDVPVGPEHARGALDELGEQSDAERSVGRAKHGDLLRGLAQCARRHASSRPVVPTRIGMSGGDRAIEARRQARRARRNRPARRHGPDRSRSPDLSATAAAIACPFGRRARSG